MFVLRHPRRAVERQRHAVPGKIGDRHEQVDRLAIGHQHRPARALLHRVEGIEQQVRKGLAAERWLKPARAHEARQLRAHLVLRAMPDGAVDDIAALFHHPASDRHRPEFGRRRQRPRVGVDQLVDVGAVQPQVGERVERLPVRERAREKNAVDPARARPRDDVGKDAQPDIAARGDSGQQFAIDRARALLGGAVMKGPRRRGEAPHFLGDAVHIDGEADSAVANQGEAQFLFPHASGDSAVWGATSPSPPRSLAGSKSVALNFRSCRAKWISFVNRYG